jgi:hypothetical protein
MPMRAVLTILWMVSVWALSAQGTIELQKLAEKYKLMTSISYNMTYTYFIGYEGKVADDVSSGFYQQQGDKYYCKAGTVEYLFDGKRLLYIDHEDKEIAVRKMQDRPTPPSFTPGQLEEMCKQTNTRLEGFDAPGKLRGLELYFEEGSPASRISIVYDPATYLITSANIFTLQPSEEWDAEPQKVRIEVRFSDYKTSKKDFPYDIKSYVIESKGKFSPVKGYKGYSMI